MGVFYPPRMPASDALSWYSQVYDTVEVNTTFHALPSEATVRGWYGRTPPGFTFALKFPREITHDLRLDWPAAEPLTRAFLRLADVLSDKRGPLLLQLPPSFWRSPANRRLLATFLDALPTDALQVAVELRHRSWAEESVERALAERNVAWCLVDGNTPNHRALLFPADFVYVRWNRSGETFDGFSRLQFDRSSDLDWWAEQLLGLPPRVGTVYGYMANEFAGFAPDSLAMLARRLGVPPVDPRSRWPQGVLF
jgi:uncharacterized protein YecE (DUF72 family)